MASAVSLSASRSAQLLSELENKPSHTREQTGASGKGEP